MILRNLLYLVTGIIGAVLLYFSLISTDRTYAIVAEVEPQKTAISFPKPVKIKSLYVKSGSKVQQGDPLLSVERPDLELEFKKLNIELDQLELAIQLLKETYEAEKRIAYLEHQQKCTEISNQQKLLQLEFKADSSFYSGLSSKPDTVVSSRLTAYQLQMDELQAKRKLADQTYQLKANQTTNKFSKESQTLQLKKLRLQHEMEVLEEERKNLIQYATSNGTIGSISVELMELAPPFKTILSIYDENPNFIKAYMNEQMKIPVEVGDKVLVESLNRSYAIEGEVIEIGSRIVSYPRQMNPANLTPLWGRELFVQIPKQNEFLNGEKVFVIIKYQ